MPQKTLTRTTRRPRPLPAARQANRVKKAITKPTKSASAQKAVPADTLKLVPLGGLEEIGRNMSFLEYEDEIVIIDMGLQFPEEDTPGIDYIIPNIAYLQPKKDNVKAVVITHGHYDHIGAVPHLIGKLGNPPIYTLPLTKAILEKRQEEFMNAPKLNIVTVKYGDKVKVGKHFELEFFGVEHTIPESMGVLIKTPVGNIVHSGDFRFDRDANGNIYRFDELQRVGKMDIHTLIVDATNALEEGYGIPETEVMKNLEELLRKAKGRIVLATFSSMLTRIGEIIKIAEKLGKVVMLNGRSMRENVEIAKRLGYIKAKKDTFVPVQEVSKYKDDKILVISTGAQGEPTAGLMRIANGEHRHIQIKHGDTFIFSSSVIPGNERSVQALTDNIARQGALVYNSKLLDIHSSGHALAGDIKLFIKTVKPRYLMPQHAYYYFRYAGGQLGIEAGVSEKNIRLLDNGSVGLLTKDDFKVSEETVPVYYVMVDGLGVGDVEEVVLRDRLTLAQEGMIVIITTLDRKSGKLVKNPDIISRGFIYLRESQELLNEIRGRIRSIISRIPRHQPLDSDYLKSLLRDQIGQFVYRETNRRPMILPVIIEI
ncbi:MAG: ribonuclease J [Candidatus Colwellbacteria bacterium]|nr:ribonuclease J [Candidatus Colwellbacteria bacterium]